ncbi:helicase SNF2 [Geodermatophilus sp. TF02-6]|uniref:DEAD/DEAH box helicase n=1 Tax=Geodermatophilus sp. TF02-6 TaxID=2250575 RepID=UPI000DE98485|nr:DEAD/DEAH box helicase [Geodermatophilus sp. TF02-6]RBY80921.1 helicase SNF2 [Geodermatophilus sp. TF02-6]
MLDEWEGLLRDDVIRSAVGAAAFRRGQQYAQAGRVSDIRAQRTRGRLSATVQGSEPRPYTTVVELDAGGRGWWGSCSCPVGADCKHVAAVLLAARQAVTDEPAPVAPDWERTLTELLRPTDRASRTAGTPLGLQFEVEEPAAGRSGALTTSARPAIRLRPVVPGAKGRWIRTGVSWRKLEYAYGYAGYTPAHASALRALYVAHQTAQEVPAYYYGETPVQLEDFGPALWPALSQAVDDGVTMLTASGAPVVLAEEPARVCVDLHRAGEDAVVEPVVTVAGTPLPASAALTLGSPAHGVVVPAGADTDDLVPDRGLLLAPLHRRAPAPLTRLLAGGALRVPEADVDRFLRDFYPALRRTVEVTSSDGSVTLPEVAPPRLALHVTYAEGSRVTLEWSVQYEAGGAVRRLPLDADRADGDPLRDRPAEERLVRGLPRPGRLPQLWQPDGAPTLVPGVRLQGMDAVVLTEQVLPELRDRHGVVVTVSGTPPAYRHSDAAPLVRVSATEGGDVDWFDLGVTVSVDGEDIPFVLLFTALAAGDTHLVLPSGTWFRIDRPEFEQLRRLIEEARALQDADRPGLRISRYQAGLWEELAALGVVEEQSRRWTREVQRLLDVDTAAPPPLPAGLAAELRPYQLQGYQWLAVLWDAGLGGVLADDMGLGKTLQTLALLCRAAEAGELTDPVLVVAPTSVVPNWVREAARFAPGLRVVAVEETDRRRGVPLAEAVAGADVVVTSYTLLRIDEEAYRSLPWRGLVLDEAQFVKNHQAKTYSCARRLPAPVKLAITGTPLENNLMDLWAQLSIVAPGLFPSPQRFTEFYRTPIERGTDPERLTALRRRIRPLIRRRTKEQVAAELPPKQEQVLEVVLNPKHRKIYDTHLARERRKVLGLVDDLDRNRFTIFKSLTVLRQLSLDPALVDDAYAGVRSSKADAFLEHLQEVVAEGHRALVFSQFTGFLRTVRDRLDAEGLPYVYLDGRTRDRARRIAEFTEGRAPVFLISLKAGGFGLNLTQADYVFVLDPWWNPAVEAQAVDRAHRIGQDRTVMVYRLVAAGTIEEKVMALKARKQDLFDRVVDDEGALSGPLTAEDIRGLFAP